MKEVRLLNGSTVPGEENLSLDLRWRTRFMTPGALPFCEFDDGDAILFAPDLEYERAKKQAEAGNFRVEKDEEFIKRVDPASLVGTLIELFRERGVEKIIVPNVFSISNYNQFSEAGFEVEPKAPRTSLYPERMIKTPEEIAYVTEVQKKTEEVVWQVVQLLREATVNEDGILIDKYGDVLTAEGVKDFMDVEFMRKRCLAVETIIACGDQAVDPHETGYGPLRANLPIVMDVFPRSKENWYWSDMSRTFFKGTPTEAAATMYQTVLDAQLMAIGMIHAGADGHPIQLAVEEFFRDRSYETGDIDGVTQGFFHAVGHGLGLAIHEEPRITRHSFILPEGSVVTVEPGLYYLGIGGVRIEDLVVVTKDGCRNLTAFPKELKDMIIP